MAEIDKGKTTLRDVRKWIEQAIIPQYHFEPQKASLIEIIANSLDAQASVIEITVNDGILEVTDNGIGMDRTTFKDYHDLFSKKTRGKGIGFIGQGAKIALTFCSKVITQTVSKNYRGYSEWQFKGEEAPYEIQHGNILDLNHQGTKVTLHLHRDSIDFYTDKWIEEILEEHYTPLLDSELLKVYSGEIPILEKGAYKQFRRIYPEKVKFIINGQEIIKTSLQERLSNKKEILITKYKKPLAWGFFGLLKETEAKESLRGVALCTYGKVIERSLFKKDPHDKEKIVGWIEAPYLVEAVTTDKCRFQGGNPKWESFFRKTQREFSQWLEEIGALEPPKKLEPAFSELEKEINSILKNLPELSFFGSQMNRDVSIPNENGEPKELTEGTQKVSGTKGGETTGGGVPVSPGFDEGKAPDTSPGFGPKAEVKPRTLRGGIRISFEEKSDTEEEAHFDGEVVTINRSHPAYKRADKDRLLNYHILKSAVLSLIKFNLDKASESSWQKVFELQQKFFRLWGER
ncbi:MAG: ATP-binding protein [candidate division WOR-3 bacterium]